MKELKNDKASFYIPAIIGLLVYIYGFLVMDGYIEFSDKMTLTDPIGLAICSLGINLILLGWCFWKFGTHKEKIEILKGRLDYLEDKIYSGSDNDGKDN